jgi:UDPglucose--hexose-1-phosphate uridylyltransferase
MNFNLNEHAHTRLNILTGEWVLVSPHRMKRPWQGKVESLPPDNRPAYDPKCYLCPGNTRADGSVNPNYSEPYSFVNDFSALLPDTPAGSFDDDGLLVAKSESGICKVICFTPRHDLTLPQMGVHDINKVVDLWQNEFAELSSKPNIKYIQIFENKGDIMGCSNPHPHGQIWASSDIPLEIHKETIRQEEYYSNNGISLLSAYLKKELQLQERLVFENDHFVALVPFWAVWPYETMIVSKRQVQYVTEFTADEKIALSETLKTLTAKYDNLFKVSFPYSAGMHQAPVNSGQHEGWHWHMHFYPPLLRSATVKKFMVGYEMLANPQRDITAERVAAQLRDLPNEHFSINS